MRGIWVATVALVAIGCESASAKRLAAVQSLVARDMRDPAATQFREVRAGTQGFVCGEVNGKNAYGAYVGFTRFIVDSTDAVRIEGDSLRFSVSDWTGSCDSVRLPTAAARSAYLDSSRRSDSLNAIAEAQAAYQRGLDRLEAQALAAQLEMVELTSGNRLEKETARVYREMVRRWAQEDLFPVFGDTLARIAYDQRCQRIAKILPRTVMLVSMDTARAKGYRDASEQECDPIAPK